MIQIPRDVSETTPGRQRPGLILHALMAVVGISLLGLIFIRPDVRSLLDGNLTGVAILKPVIGTVIWYSSAVSFLLLLVISSICWKRRMRAYYGACAVVAVFVFPTVAVYRIGQSVAPWVVCSKLPGPDGSTYTFLDSSFLQGRTLALGRVATDGWLYQHFDVLGRTTGDKHRCYALIVRPTDNVRTTYGQLHLTGDNILLGLRSDNRCYFAYDFSKERFLSHGDDEEVSPFLLVGAQSRLYEVDVETLLPSSERRPAGLPSRRILLDAAAHPNSEVRRLAERLLAQMDPE